MLNNLKTNFNNVFAVLIMLLIFGATFINMPWINKPNDFVLGTMWGTGFTLVLQFFYRKAKTESDPPATDGK